MLAKQSRSAAPIPVAIPTPEHARVLRARLRAWYRKHRRDLPWRATRDPYAIWISEAMLQQTRVETAAPYWHRFLARFPDVAALAAAGEDEVLALWSGLGYYRRARSLHAAARVIAARHGGRFPRTLAEVLELPGIGPYTAGAVLSIAFDQPQPLVDGNVERVLARLFALELPAASPELSRRTRELAHALVPRRGAGEWNQALMELGATLCTPREPRCETCPISPRCAARAAGLQRQVPTPRARPPSIDVDAVLLLVLRHGELLLERRAEGGLMAGMWQLPSFELAAGTPLLFAGAPPAGLMPAEELGELRHAITRHRIRALVRRATAPQRVAAPLAWHPRDALERLALTGMTRKALRAPFSRAGLAGARGA